MSASAPSLNSTATKALKQAESAKKTFYELRERLLERLSKELPALRVVVVPTPKVLPDGARQGLVVLYYTKGTSDKTYESWYEGSMSKGFTVYTAYGRRGGTLKKSVDGTYSFETPADGRVDAIVRAKKAKGYTTDISGTPLDIK